jgi:SRSO17 transposase
LIETPTWQLPTFRVQRETRELSYVLQVKGGTSAYPQHARRGAPVYRGTGRPPKPRYRERRLSLKTLALAAGREALQTVTWREGSRGKLSSRFSRCGCDRRTSSFAAPPARTSCRLPGLSASGPTASTSRSSTGSPTCPKKRYSRGSSHSRSCAGESNNDYRELKDALGLDHFEGRSFRGWHHHVTLVSFAHGFLTLERLNPKALAPA